MDELNDKQRRFVEAMLIEPSAKAAYVKAGYRARGSAAEVNASRLLRNAKVKEALAQAREARAERTKISADKVLKEYARVAFSSMREFASWGPDGVRWKRSEALSEDAVACIAEITETVRELDDGGTSSTKRFKLHNKLTALQDVAKHLGLLGKDGGINVNVNVNGEETDVGRTAREIREIDRHIEELDRQIEELAPRAPEGGFGEGEA